LPAQFWLSGSSATGRITVGVTVRAQRLPRSKNDPCEPSGLKASTTSRDIAEPSRVVTLPSIRMARFSPIIQNGTTAKPVGILSGRFIPGTVDVDVLFPLPVFELLVAALFSSSSGDTAMFQ
jgi:hypothetical protein